KSDMHPTSESISPDIRRPAALHGIAASPGIARGPAFLCPCGKRLAVPRYAVGENELPGELEKLEAAIRDAQQDLQNLQNDTSTKLGKKEAGIFEVQILLLHDTTFLSEITGRCLREKINVEAALAGAVEKLTASFTQLQDPYFRERAADLRDVG